MTIVLMGYLPAAESASSPDVVCGIGSLGAVNDHAEVVHRAYVVVRLFVVFCVSN